MKKIFHIVLVVQALFPALLSGQCDPNGIWVERQSYTEISGLFVGNSNCIRQGVTVQPLQVSGDTVRIGQYGASSGYVLSWNGTNWIPTSPSALDTRRTVDTVYDYTALRAYSGDSPIVFVKKDGIEGFFKRASGSGWVDDGGITISGTYDWRRIAGNIHRVNVKWFGAVGDSTTNDNSAIQAALSWCKDSSDATLYFPAGKYRYTSAINYYKPVNFAISGDGMHNTYLFPENTTGISIRTDTTSTLYYGDYGFAEGRDFQIRDLSIMRVGTTTFDGKQYGIDLRGGFGKRIENVAVRSYYASSGTGVGSVGIRLWQPYGTGAVQHTIFDNVYVYGCDTGIVSRLHNTMKWRDVKVVACKKVGVALGNSVTWDGGLCQSNENCGLYLRNSDPGVLYEVTIRGVHFEGNAYVAPKWGGIYKPDNTDMSDLVITDCFLGSPGNSHIMRLKRVQHSSITNNRWSGSATTDTISLTSFYDAQFGNDNYTSLKLITSDCYVTWLGGSKAAVASEVGYSIGTASPGSNYLNAGGGIAIGSTYAVSNTAPTNGAIIQGSVGIGNNSPTQPLHVTGNARVTGALYDSNNDPGTSGQILSSTVTGTDWIAAPTGSDNWGSQVVERDSSLSGNGTTSSPLGVNGYSAASVGQVPSKSSGGISWITPLTAEADGSVTNELQTLSNTSDATSHTATLSSSGGSLKLAEGTGIGLSTTGTALDGVVTITNTAPDQTVSLTGAGINAVTGTYPSFTITGTEVDGSVSNEGVLGVGAGGSNDALLTSNTSGATGTTIQGGGIVTVTESTSSNGGTITITGTEVDGSTTNELQTLSNASDATSHTVTLSNSGGSVKFAEGSGITLTTTGTSSDGTVTIASTSTGTVTSVGLTMPTGFSVSGSPVTSSGTLGVTTSLNGVIKGNGSGFSASNVGLTSEVTGILPVANGGTGLSSLTAGRIPYGNGTSAFNNSGNLTFASNLLTIGGFSMSAGLAMNGALTISPGGVSISSNSNLMAVTFSPTMTANNLSINGLSLAYTPANDGTRTNQNYASGKFSTTTASTTAASVSEALNLSVTNSSPNITQQYLFRGTMTENATSGTLTTRTGSRMDITKGSDALDSGTGTGIQATVQDNTTSGRWNLGYGIVTNVTNAITARGINPTITTSKGTGNTQYGIDLVNNVSGSGVTVSNAYGVALNSTASGGGVITNYYGLYQASVPSGATNTYFLYNNQSAHSYTSGGLSLGVNSTGAKFTSRGTGTTSGTYSGVFEKSDGTDVLVVRDDGKVAIANDAFNEALNVNGQVRADAYDIRNWSTTDNTNDGELHYENGGGYTAYLTIGAGERRFPILPHMVQLQAIDYNVDWTTGRTKAFWTVPARFNGWLVSKVYVSVSSIGSTTGNVVAIEKGGSTIVSQTISSASHEITLDNSIATDDIFTFNITSLGATASKGLFVEIELRHN